MSTQSYELSDGLKDVGTEVNQSLYNTDISAFEDRYTFQKTGDVGVTVDTVVLESGKVLNLVDRLVLADLQRGIEEGA